MTPKVIAFLPVYNQEAQVGDVLVDDAVDSPLEGPRRAGRASG